MTARGGTEDVDAVPRACTVLSIAGGVACSAGGGSQCGVATATVLPMKR